MNYIYIIDGRDNIGANVEKHGSGISIVYDEKN